MSIRYVGLPEVGTGREKRFLYEADRKTKVRQVLWGDFLDVEGRAQNGWLKVIWARRDPDRMRELYIPADHTVERRPLEIVFLDVGQGDGAVIITPERGDDERVIVVDAGRGRNMNAFLDARFHSYRGGRFDAAIIIHPNEDHYGGFKPIFENPELGRRTAQSAGGGCQKVGADQRRVLRRHLCKDRRRATHRRVLDRGGFPARTLVLLRVRPPRR
jgi:beta-lactamase superfamily II metal-dependent hydrolase